MSSVCAKIIETKVTYRNQKYAPRIDMNSLKVPVLIQSAISGQMAILIHWDPKEMACYEADAVLINQGSLVYIDRMNLEHGDWRILHSDKEVKLTIANVLNL